MATSSIVLYYNTKDNLLYLEESKHFIIDDIADYLSSKNKITIYNAQYIKNALEVDIKLDLSQVYSSPLYENGIRYVSITNSDENRTFYYFVSNSEWRSQNSVKLKLKLDVLNTYKYNDDYIVSERTLITREHKNRVGITPIYEGDVNLTLNILTTTAYHSAYVVGTTKFEYEGDPNFRSVNVFAFNEGDFSGITGETLASALQYVYSNKEKYIHIYLDNGSDIDVLPCYSLSLKYGYNFRYYSDTMNYEFYIVFISSQSAWSDGAVVRIDIPNSDGSTISLTAINSDLSFELRSSDVGYIPNGNFYGTYWDRGDGKVTTTLSSDSDVLKSLKSSELIFINSAQLDATRTDVSIDPINPSSLIVEGIISGYNAYRKIDFVSEEIDAPLYKTDLNDIVETDSTFSSLHWFLVYRNQNEPDDTTSNPVECYLLPDVQTSIYVGSDNEGLPSYENISSINSIDRTDSKLIKIIALPYAPIPINTFYIAADGYSIISPEGWSATTFTNGSNTIRALKLSTISTKFSNTFLDYGNDDPLSVLYIGEVSDSDFDDTELRNDKRESKIYHSDFYEIKFIYDAFNTVIPLEIIDVEAYILSLPEHATLTFTATSTINSKFLFSIDNIPLKEGHGLQDYDFVISCTRNNEEALYTNAYITYLRTGYNYDLKSISYEQQSLNWDLLSNALLLIGGIGMSAFGGGIGAIGGVGLIASGLSGIASTFKSGLIDLPNSYNSLEKQLSTLQSQTTSIRDSNDVDLLRAYSNNRAKWSIYQPRSELKEVILDYFYYYGYKQRTRGVPDVNSRRHFNYIECDIDLDYVCNMSDEIFKTLYNTFKSGVTFIHNVNNTRDVEQVLNNYEVELKEIYES